MRKRQVKTKVGGKKYWTPKAESKPFRFQSQRLVRGDEAREGGQGA